MTDSAKTESLEAGQGEEMPVALPLVSIITATFQAAATLLACLESVKAQKYPRIQHIVIDAASTDGTVELLREYAGEHVVWISEPDRGVYDAWNKGLERAEGEWIAFLGADDELLPDAVSAYMRLAEAHPEAEYLSSYVRWISASGKARRIGGPWEWSRFRRYMCTAHVASMHRRSLFERVGRYDDKLRIVADYELLLRAGPSLKTAFLPQVTVKMLGGGNSDNLKGVNETALVKRSTGSRRALVTEMERWWASIVFTVRRWLD